MKRFYNQDIFYDHLNHLFFVLFFNFLTELFVNTFFLLLFFKITIFADDLEDLTRHFLTHVSVVNIPVDESLMHVINEEGLTFTRLVTSFDC